MKLEILQNNKKYLSRFDNKIDFSKTEIQTIRNQLRLRPSIIKISFVILFILRLFDPLRIKILANKVKIKLFQNRVNKLKLKQHEKIKEYLIENDLTFQKLVKKNYELLTAENIRIKMYRTAGHVARSYAIKFKGTIHNNGFLYLKTIKRNILFLSFQSGLFPSILGGNIDYLGNATLETLSVNWRLIGGRVPTVFTGNININGTIYASINKSVWELGHFSMDKLLCDPFNGDENKRSKFLNNREKILEIIDEYKKKYS